MHIVPLINALSWPLNWLLPGGPFLTGACQQLASVAVTALWQGALISLGLSTCLRLTPSTSATRRFLVWSAGFAALVVLSVWPFFPHLQPSPAHLPASVPTTAAGPLLQLDLRWSLLIAALWLSLTAWRAVDLLIHLFQLRKLYKSATPVPFAGSALFSLGGPGSKPIETCITASLQRPCVIGFFAPRILIPDWLYPQLTPQELEHILRHEAEHLRRRDDWTNLLQKLCLLLFPLNPALLWIERRLCQEREMACDDSVVAATQAPRAYAECLARLAEHALRSRSEALSLGIWQRRPELVRRVHSLLLRTRPAGPFATFATLAVSACALLFGSMELARCPQLIAFVPSPQPAIHAAPALQAAEKLNASVSAAGHKIGRVDKVGSMKWALAHVNAHSSASFARPSIHLTATAARMPQPSPSPDSNQSTFANVIMSELPELPQRPVLVLSFLDRFQLPASSVQIISDFETGPTPDSADELAGSDHAYSGRAASQLPAQFSRPAQVTITRLIVRILPSTYVSGHPPVAANTGSWLVIQL